MPLTTVKPDHHAVEAALKEVRSKLAAGYAKFFMTRVWRRGGPPHEYDVAGAITRSDVRKFLGTPYAAGLDENGIRAKLAAEFRAAARNVKIRGALS